MHVTQLHSGLEPRKIHSSHVSLHPSLIARVDVTVHSSAVVLQHESNALLLILVANCRLISLREYHMWKV